MLKKIKRSEILDMLDQNKEVYMLVPVLPDTTVSELLEIETFFADIEDEEETEEDETEDETDETEDEAVPAEDTKPSAVHQKIVNMYLAGRTIKYIAQELDKSPGTVHYHLRKDGLV